MAEEQHSQPPNNVNALLKVKLPGRIWDSDLDEVVWAEPLGVSRVKLKNIPFFSYNVSYDDVLNIRKTEVGLEATSVNIRSGHSTYRFFVREGQLERALGSYWKAREKFGCTYERATRHLFAIDVPPKSDIQVTFQKLTVGEEDGVWEFEEGHCGHPP